MTESVRHKKIIAAAISYEPSKDAAPKVIAKGHGTMADLILKVARENNLPITSNEELANLLDLCEIGDYIPVEAFVTVAEILSTLSKYKSI